MGLCANTTEKKMLTLFGQSSMIQEIKRFIVLKETLVGEHLKKIVDLNFRKLNSISSIIFLNLAL